MSLLLTLSLLGAPFSRKNEPFLLENASNLTHKFLYTIHASNLMHFQGEMVSVFLQKRGAENESDCQLSFKI